MQNLATPKKVIARHVALIMECRGDTLGSVLGDILTQLPDSRLIRSMTVDDYYCMAMGRFMQLRRQNRNLWEWDDAAIRACLRTWTHPEGRRRWKDDRIDRLLTRAHELDIS